MKKIKFLFTSLLFRMKFMERKINIFDTKNRHFVIPILMIVFLFSFSLYNDPLSRIEAGFAAYLEKLPQEKVFIHFDKPYYTTGETIWLKAYLTAGAYHEPSSLSNPIYVEVINEKGELVQHLKLLSINGSTAGSISIPESWASGNYLVRAYTNWMKNSGEEYFFHRSVKIWNNEIPADHVQQDDHIDIQFFPEGGDLVNGILSKVAFKAIGTDGLGRKIEGKILEGNKTICAFESNSLGMGVFYLNPQKGKTYKALIENDEKEVMLPQSKESGLVLSASNLPTSNEIAIQIQTSDYRIFNTIYIVGQTRGLVWYSARSNLSSNIAVAKIPKTKIPSGIAQITVTDQNGIPLSERLIFVDQKDQLTFNVTTDKATYAPRELITLDIQATDASGKPVVADLSLSVCDNQQVFMDENRENINSYLLLSSELTGHIESPGYYFNPSNEDRHEALDYLLLTQGWRRFTIKDALEQKWEPPLYKIEQGLTITGKMVDPYNNKPVIDGKVTYVSAYPIRETKTVRTNSKGEFEINNIVYFDSTNVLLQGETKKGGKAKIIVDHVPDSPALQFPLLAMKETQHEFERTFIAKSMERKAIDKAYDFDEKIVMLDEVVTSAKRSDIENTVPRIYGEGSISINVSDHPLLENLFHPLQLVQGRVAGVHVMGSGVGWSVLIRGSGSISSGTSPLILLDNMPVPIESLASIPVRDIESFTVWKGPNTAIFGARGANGAIGFYTKRGVNNLSSSEESLIVPAGIGFQFERQFYAPKYDVQKQEHIKPDKRATLFWAPYIQTDSFGRASISFYNHDVETTVTGTLEGISATGSAGSVNFEYKITKNQ